MLKKILYSPIVSLIFIVLSSAFLITFITVRLNYLLVAESTIGYIHSAFYAGMLLGAIRSDRLINRIGHIRAHAAFSSVTIIAALLMAMSSNTIFWLLIRFVTGFATAALYVIVESWLLSQAGAKNKGRILSIYMLCLYSSQAISQFLLNIVDLKTTAPFLLAGMLSAFATIPCSVTYMKEPVINTNLKIRIHKYFKASPFGFIGCIIAGLILSAIYSFLAKYAQDNNFSVSLLLGLTILGGFCLQWPIGKLSDIFDRAKVLTVIAGLTIIPCIAIVIKPAFYIIYFYAFLLGGVCFTIYPVSIAQVCDHIDFSRINIVNVTGTLLFSYDIGAVLGPLIGAFCIERFSSVAIFYYIIVNAILLLLLGIYTIKRVKPVENEEQVDFVAMPSITPVTNSLDPRS